MSNKKIVFQTDWFEIESEEFEDIPSLEGKPIYRILEPDSVLIVAFTTKHDLLLIRQFRPAQNAYTLEIPAGTLNASEAPLEAATRELLEETGYECARMQYAGKGIIAADRIKSCVHVFLGTGAEQKTTFQHEQGIETLCVTPDELKKKLLRNDFQQLSGLGALLFVKLRLNPPELAGF